MRLDARKPQPEAESVERTRFCVDRQAAGIQCNVMRVIARHGCPSAASARLVWERTDAEPVVWAK